MSDFTEVEWDAVLAEFSTDQVEAPVENLELPLELNDAGVKPAGDKLNGHHPHPAKKSQASFNLTDEGNAKRLVSMFGDRLKFVSVWGWMWYDDIRWVPVDDVFVQGLARRVLQAMEQEALELGRSEDKDARDRGKQLGTWAYKCEFQNHVELMANKARSELQAAITDFNPDGWLFNALI